jgi:DNA-binding transcriptional regulator YiaG
MSHKPYRYTESGLDYVYLENGFEEIDTPYGRALEIEGVDALHRAIGKWLLQSAKALTGAEFRFLRHELDLSQKQLGRLMGEPEQNIGRWERARSKHVNPSADRIIRALYSESVGSNKTLRELIEALSEGDDRKRLPLRLQTTKRGWKVSADELLGA